jgi:peptide/nickel transport system permease protein
VESRPPDRRLRFGAFFWTMAVWLALMLIAVLVVQWLPLPKPNAVDVDRINGGVSASHLLGTDDLGRDVLSRTLWSVRPSVGIGALAVVMAAAIGGALGVLAGSLRGWVEELVVLWANVFLAFPALVLILALVTFLGPSPGLIVLIFALVGAPAFARVARASALAVAGRDFVLGSRALGMRRRDLIVREIAPHVMPAVGAYSLVILGLAIVALAELSFVGAGLTPPRATWGGMINEGRDYLETAPFVVVPPCLALGLTVLALNVIGSTLSERYDSTGASTL